MKHKHKPMNPATKKVFRAVHAGKIERQQTCEVCGGTKQIEAHHDDYSKPYEIRWLCHKCHMQHHAALRPVVLATCGHGPISSLGLCRSCYEKDLRRRNPGFAERQRENCRNWHRRNND